MKYFITEYKNQEAKDSLRSLGLFCYSLRSDDNNWGEIASIEEHVLANLYGSIITNEEIKLGSQYPDNFIDFNEFALKNKKVNSLCDLKDNLEDYGTLDLSNDDNLNNEFSYLFSSCENFEELNKMSSKEKFNFFMEHYKNVNDYELIDLGGHIYQLIHINNEKIKEMELTNA